MNNELMQVQSQLFQVKKDYSLLESEISDLKDKLKDIEKNPQEYENLERFYNESLDDCYREVCDQLPVCVTGSQLIAKLDPTMYRCGYDDFMDDWEYSSMQVYQDTEEELTEKEDELSNLEQEIEELEQEIEDLENEEAE